MSVAVVRNMPLGSAHTCLGTVLWVSRIWVFSGFCQRNCCNCCLGFTFCQVHLLIFEPQKFSWLSPSSFGPYNLDLSELCSEKLIYILIFISVSWVLYFLAPAYFILMLMVFLFLFIRSLQPASFPFHLKEGLASFPNTACLLNTQPAVSSQGTVMLGKCIVWELWVVQLTHFISPRWISQQTVVFHSAAVFVAVTLYIQLINT